MRLRNVRLPGVFIRGAQYAWIGNGFGWNYLATNRKSTDTKTGDGDHVLGMVYYSDAPNFQTITGRKAHVGFYDSPTRLVWITHREVFLEDVFAETEDAQEHYVITALFHDLFADQPVTLPDGVPAKCGRLPNKRPDFKSFVGL